MVFLPLNFDKYIKKAEEIREVLAKYDERYEAGSNDEAFLNITKVYHAVFSLLSHHKQEVNNYFLDRQYMEGHPEITVDEVVEQIRAEVFERSKISVSAGIAPNARVISPLQLPLVQPFN